MALPTESIASQSAYVGNEEAVDGLRAAGADFWRRGWSLGTSSNYSVVVSRDPLELIVTASGKDKGHLTRDDFVRVDGAGCPVVDHQPKSSAETLLHVVLAKHAGAGAILHTHSVWGTLLSDKYGDAGELLIDGYEMLKGLHGVRSHEHTEVLPIYENTQDIAALAEQISTDLTNPDTRPAHGFLIRRHGLYTWGRDLAEARRHVEIWEFLLECVARKGAEKSRAESPESRAKKI